MRVRVGFALVLLMVSTIPIAWATGGHASIASIDVNGPDVGPGPIEVGVNLSLDSGDLANLTLAVNVSDVTGDVVHAIEANITLTEAMRWTNSTPVLQPGTYTIDVTLSGQVSSAIPTGHGLNFSLETVIERPLDVRVREPSMWVIDGRNDTGGITSNSSLRDGDRLVAQVPVQNSGGVPWNGTLAARLDGSSVHVFPDAVVALAPHQTQIVVLESPFGLQAGTYHLNVSINATGDGNRSDEMHNLTIVVDPPPRPSLTVGLESVSDVEHGVVATWNLTMQNHGERPWSGWVNCSIGSDVGTSSGRLTLPVGQVITSQVNLTARAGALTCLLDGTRQATNGASSVSQTLDLPVARFSSAGEALPMLSIGTHEGDSWEAALLVMNRGNRSGNAFLTVELDNMTHVGASIEIPPGGVGDLRVMANLGAGVHVGDWSVGSTDGLVDGGLNGTLTADVLSPQRVTTMLTMDAWSPDRTTGDIWIDLSEGASREVSMIIEFLPVDGPVRRCSEQILLLDAGRRHLDVDLPAIWEQGDMRASVITSWTTAPESILQMRASLDDARPIATIDQTTVQAAEPMADDVVEVTMVLSNRGESLLPAGSITIHDGLRRPLGVVPTPEMGVGSTNEVTLDITWPPEQLVTLDLLWMVGEIEVIEEVSVTSGAVEPSESTQSGVNGRSVIAGVGVGLGVLMLMVIIRVWRAAAPNPVVNRQGHDEETDPSSQPEAIPPNVEVGCPECAQTLRVPGTYQGRIRCPACDHRFQVDSKDQPNTAPDVVEGSSSKEAQVTTTTTAEEPEASSSSDVIACPSCTARLKVPLERRPTRARCPACRTEFRALESKDS